MIQHSPHIVTSGLTLYLDAANTKSFPGEPTINLFTNPTLSTTLSPWSTNRYPTGVTYGPLDGAFIENGTLKILHQTGYNNTQTYLQQNLRNLITGLTYTYSVYCKSDTNSLAILDYYDGAWNHSYYTGNGEWQRLTATSIPTEICQFRLGVYTSGTAVAYFKNVQCEQKPYATAFVNGTRSATAGWRDLSGNFSNGDLSGVVFNSSNDGSLVFSGSSIDLGSSTPKLYPNSTDYTWCGWLNFSGYTGNYRTIWCGNAGNGLNGFGIYLSNATNSLCFEINGTSGGRQIQSVDVTNYLTKYHYWAIVIVQISYQIKIYVDTVLINTLQYSNWVSIIQQQQQPYPSVLIGKTQLDWNWLLSSTGDGSGVNNLDLSVNTDTVLTLTDAGRFYDDAGGTTNSGITRTITPSNHSVYIKVPSGTSILKISSGKNSVTKVNNWDGGANGVSCYFDLYGCPTSITYFYFPNSQTISGNLNNISTFSTTLTWIALPGSGNAIIGTIPPFSNVLRTFQISNANTLSGTIPNLPSTMSLFMVQGNNTLSGTIPTFPTGLTRFQVQGSNTISGIIPAIPINFNTFYLTGNNTVSGYTNSISSNVMNYFYFVPVSPGGLSANDAANLIIALDGITWTGTSRTLYLKGSNATPTPSLTLTNAINDLTTNKSVTVTFNTTDWVWGLSSTGDGSGVSTLQLIVNATTTLFLNGSGLFYDDVSGTTNSGTTRTITSGGNRTVYLKVPSGNSTLTMTGGRTTVTQINNWDSVANAASTYFDLSSCPTVLTYIYLLGNNTITGTLSGISTFSTIMTYIYIAGGNTISGTIPTFSSSMSYFYMAGNNTISGTVPSLPSSLVYFLMQGSNTISGTIPSFPTNLLYFYATGYNTLSGAIPSFGSVFQRFYVSGNNTLSGTIPTFSSTMTYFYVSGSFNTISGTIPSLSSTMIYFYVTGNNTISGTIPSSLPSSMNTFLIGGNNTLSGIIPTLPSGFNTFYVSGNNTINGIVPAIPTGFVQLLVSGNNTISGYTNSFSTNVMNYFYLTPSAPGGLSANDAANLIIALDGITWTGTSRILYLKGNNATPTPSTALTNAKNDLTTNKLVAITTN